MDRPMKEHAPESILEHLVRESLLAQAPLPTSPQAPEEAPWIEPEVTEAPPPARIQVRGIEDPDLLQALAALARMSSPNARTKPPAAASEFARANPDPVLATDFKPDSLLRRPRDASPILRPKKPLA